ncbi:hypothetical protein BH24ACT4_BH24ACT4_17810 [soil metagenome]
MTTTDPTDAPPAPAGEAPGRGVLTWRVVGVMALLAIALFWLWIFSGAARKQNPDFLSDRAWVEDAEVTCAATMATIDDRAAPAGRQDQATRADAIDASTEDLRVMLADLGSPGPDDADDRALVDQWLSDWDQLLVDRSTYADAIRVNPDAQFFTTEKFSDPLDKVIEVFADVNDMPSCGPAGDVG